MEFSPINLPARQALDLAYQTLFTFENPSDYYIDYKCMNAFSKFFYNAFQINGKKKYMENGLFGCFIHIQSLSPEACSINIGIDYLIGIRQSALCPEYTVIAEFMRRFSAELPG